MSTIRRQSIVSSAIIYFGFALGFVNTYLFTREGGFTPTQYGLTSTFMAIANIMYSFASLGMVACIHKFYPYYHDNLSTKANDMMSWALLSSFIGFLFVLAAGLLFKGFVIQKFGANSAALITYYYWIFPFGFGLTIYSLLEAFAWQIKKSVLANFFREIQFRIFTTILILAYMLHALTSFDGFIKIFAFTYLLLALCLMLYLIFNKKLYFNFSPSRVTRKFLTKIATLAALVWSGGLVYNIASFFAIIVIAAVVPGGLASASVFVLAQNIASLMQAPQRGIISASVGPLSKAWKDKDLKKINLIYKRSSINQLIFSTGMFVLIWVNFTDGVFSFHLQKHYLDARFVFLFIGLMRIVDMGTGVNSQIIGTSIFWRFDFITGVILFSLTIPLNYVLAKNLGVVGPAMADLVTFSAYNFIRYLFLLRKFDMQPFTSKSLYALLIGIGGYAVCHFLFRSYHGISWIVIRSLTFLSIYLTGVVALRLSEDILPVWEYAKKRTGLYRK